MKYNKIEIIENTTPSEAKRKFFIVSDKHLNELKLYSVYHGFLSFEIDHYNDTEKKEDATPKKELEAFVKSILFIN
tara:strand:+ start:2005 stop:2232 length:228 start_codon:yes stop_codon:yes gene_type:complete